MRIPPRFTWKCQPADVAWNKPLKDFLRRKWLNNLRDQIRLGNSPVRIVSPSRVNVVTWIIEAWEHVRVSTIVKGFVRTKLIDEEDMTQSSVVA